MNIEEIKSLASGGETTEVEFKRSTGQRTEATKTVCAMLNGKGGFMMFGIANDGSLVGQELGELTLSDVLHELRKIEPQVPITPEVVAVHSEKFVIVLRVPSASGAMSIYTFDGRPYLRHGSTTIVMKQEEYRRKLIEQMHPSHRWEMQAATGMEMSDLDDEQIIQTVEEAVRRGRLNEPNTRDIRLLLQGLGLVKQGALINAGVVLFARSDRLLPNYSQCLLKLVRYRGLSTAEFADNRQVHGNLFDLFQLAQSFLREHLPIAGRVTSGNYEREDDPVYPLVALREALVNALCHRNYAVTGGSIGVAIFDDRLEVSSTGLLPFGITVRDLEQWHASRPWNPVLAQVLFRRGLIEQWGGGTLRMREAMVSVGLPPPEVVERTGEVVVRFFSTGVAARIEARKKLTDVEQKVLQTLSNRGMSAAAEIHETLRTEFSPKQIDEALQSLREDGVVELFGHARDLRWRISR